MRRLFPSGLSGALDTDRWSLNHQAVVGLLCLALLSVVTTYGVKYAFGAYEPGYDLTARFAGAGQNLDTESVVKLRGVDVGRVESISLDDEDRAVVRVRIEPDVEVPATATAIIRPISIFGPKYIDLVPGNGEGDGPFLGDGDEIAHTRSALELSEILGNADRLLSAVDPQDMTTVLHTFAEGVDGLGQELSDSVTNGQTVLDGMIASSEDRHELFDSMATIADDLADEGDTILGIGANSHEALPTISEHEQDFAGLLDATSRLSESLADVVTDNADVLGPAAQGGADLSDVTADDLGGLVSYLDFVNTYGGVLSQVIRVPVAGEAFLSAAQQFLLGSNICQAFVDVPGCHAPSIDPGPGAAGRPGSPP
jgi:phospholipid/cholesterol/gamma-HCH transport system substrate-binding protein